MNTFWNNIFQFLRFFLSVLIGFFLTTFSSFFESLNNPKQSIITIIAISFGTLVLLQTLKLMLGLN